MHLSHPHPTTGGEHRASNTQDSTPDPLLDRVAEQVVRRGLVTPAVFFLELHRPLSFLAGQATHALQPFLAPLFGYETVQRLARLLEDPANVDRLLDRIEQREAGVQDGPGAGAAHSLPRGTGTRGGDCQNLTHGCQKSHESPGLSSDDARVSEHPDPEHPNT